MSHNANKQSTISRFALPALPALLALLALTLVVGCSEESSDGTGGGEVRSREGELEATLSDGVVRGGPFTLPVETDRLEIALVGSPPESLNPWRDPSNSALLLFPRAIRRDPETLRWEPWLAESRRIDADRRGIEVTVREGGFWSDGAPVVAADWVIPANRYFSDPGLRTPYRDAPEYAALRPRWFDLGEKRFRIVVDRPTDVNTLLSLAALPPLPSSVLEDGDGSPLSTADLNALWRLEGDLPRSVSSAGPYLLDSTTVDGVDDEAAGEIRVLEFRRNPDYRDPRYGSAAARELILRYVDPGSRASAEGADVIYLGAASGRTWTQRPEGYRRLLTGTDLTPATLFIAPEEPLARQLRSVAVMARESFLSSPGERPRVRRRYPALGEFAGEGGPGELPSGVDSEQSTETAPETPEDSKAPATPEASLKMLVLDRPQLRGYTEKFLSAGADYEIIPTYVGPTELAESLLTPESWDLLLMESSEKADPLLGDPLLGSLLPLSGQWDLLAAGAPAAALSVRPFPPAELPTLREQAFDSDTLRLTLLRLWRTIGDSSREADRGRAIAAYRELWDRYQPWVYLFDEERHHFVRPGVMNLRFRDVPGAQLGVALPYIYREE